MALTTSFHGFVSCVLILLRIPLSPLFLVHLVHISLFAYLPVNIILYIFVLYTGCNYIVVSLPVFIFLFYFDHWGVWLLQASLFSIYSLTSTGIKGILLRCSSCILTLRICFMSAAGVDDYNFYMQAGDSWLCELLYELLLQHFLLVRLNWRELHRKGKECPICLKSVMRLFKLSNENSQNWLFSYQNNFTKWYLKTYISLLTYFFKIFNLFELCHATIQTVNWKLPSGYSVTKRNLPSGKSNFSDKFVHAKQISSLINLFMLYKFSSLINFVHAKQNFQISQNYPIYHTTFHWHY